MTRFARALASCEAGEKPIEEFLHIRKEKSVASRADRHTGIRWGETESVV